VDSAGLPKPHWSAKHGEFRGDTRAPISRHASQSTAKCDPKIVQHTTPFPTCEGILGSRRLSSSRAVTATLREIGSLSTTEYHLFLRLFLGSNAQSLHLRKTRQEKTAYWRPWNADSDRLSRAVGVISPAGGFGELHPHLATQKLGGWLSCVTWSAANYRVNFCRVLLWL
jgi:hypothetical protein